MDKLEIKRLFRELRELKNGVSESRKDREIFEDIIGSIKALSEKWTFHRAHIDQKVEDVKSTVKESQFETEAKVEEVKDIVENKGDQVKEDIIKGVANEVSK